MAPPHTQDPYIPNHPDAMWAMTEAAMLLKDWLLNGEMSRERVEQCVKRLDRSYSDVQRCVDRDPIRY